MSAAAFRTDLDPAVSRWVDQPEVVHLHERTAAGVELDGKGDELEQHRSTEQDDADLNQTGRAEKEAADNQPGPELGTDAGGPHQGATDLQRLVRLGMLNGVADLVGGDGRPSHTGLVVIGGREAHHPLDRVVGVGEGALYPHDGHVVKAVGIENGPCNLSTGEAGRVGNLSQRL